MTLVHGSREHAGDAKTHVFIVGVGEYPHLMGGRKPTRGLPPLGQLTSPPISARAIADWFIKSMNNPQAPLGSVELLISDTNSNRYTQSTGKSVKIEPATFDNIKRAFDRWYARCDAHRDNVAVFYFCGHGVQKDVMMLMPRDVGRSKLTAWELAIDFDATYRGMTRCAARTQYYLIDACRQVTNTMLGQDFAGRRLVESDVWQQNDRIAPKVLATTDGYAAFGDSEGVSRYTKALIDALDGGGADKRNGRWIVDNDHLARAMQQIIVRENASLPTAEHQRIVSGGDTVEARAINVLTKPPLAVAQVGCAPLEATDVAELSLRGAKKYRRPPTAKGIWSEKVLAGAYTVAASFKGKQFKNHHQDEFIRPPVSEITLEVTK